MLIENKKVKDCLINKCGLKTNKVKYCFVNKCWFKQIKLKIVLSRNNEWKQIKLKIVLSTNNDWNQKLILCCSQTNNVHLHGPLHRDADFFRPRHCRKSGRAGDRVRVRNRTGRFRFLRLRHRRVLRELRLGRTRAEFVRLLYHFSLRNCWKHSHIGNYKVTQSPFSSELLERFSYW